MEKKQYEKPQITTYTEKEILDIIGPAQTIITGSTGNS
jgi:hypothetical protein